MRVQLHAWEDCSRYTITFAEISHIIVLDGE